MAGHSDLNPERQGGEGREGEADTDGERERERVGGRRKEGRKREIGRGGRLLLSADAEGGGGERVGGFEERCERGKRGMEGGRGWEEKASVPRPGQFDEMSNAGT